jgi:proteasome lid subunit RPN8/RPN11
MPRRFGLTAAEMRGLDQTHVDAAVRRGMLSSARRAAAAGGEACAALYGTADGPVLRIGRQRRLDNAASGACLAVPVASLLDGGCPDRLVGLFHSHPRSEAVPSDLDRLAIARLPFVWAIAGATGGWTLRFFAWSAAGLRELPGQAAAGALHS